MPASLASPLNARHDRRIGTGLQVGSELLLRPSRRWAIVAPREEPADLRRSRGDPAGTREQLRREGEPPANRAANATLRPDGRNSWQRSPSCRARRLGGCGCSPRRPGRARKRGLQAVPLDKSHSISAVERSTILASERLGLRVEGRPPGPDVPGSRVGGCRDDGRSRHHRGCVIQSDGGSRGHARDCCCRCRGCTSGTPPADPRGVDFRGARAGGGSDDQSRARPDCSLRRSRPAHSRQGVDPPGCSSFLGRRLWALGPRERPVDDQHGGHRVPAQLALDRRRLHACVCLADRVSSRSGASRLGDFDCVARIRPALFRTPLGGSRARTSGGRGESSTGSAWRRQRLRGD